MFINNSAGKELLYKKYGKELLYKKYGHGHISLYLYAIDMLETEVTGSILTVRHRSMAIL